MKLLMFYAHEWWFRTASKSLPEAPEREAEERLDRAVVVFFHAESEDEPAENPEDRQRDVVRKFIKNVKWLAGKFETKNIVLHSFNHLSSSKSSPEFARGVLEEVTSRLEGSGFRVLVTPFGYFNEFRMHVAGDSLAKVFKEI